MSEKKIPSVGEERSMAIFCNYTILMDEYLRQKWEIHVHGYCLFYLQNCSVQDTRRWELWKKTQQKTFYISGSLPYYSYDSLLFYFFLQFESIKNKKRKSIKVTDDSFSEYKLVYFPCVNSFWD